MTDDNDIYDNPAKCKSKLKCFCASFARGLMKWKSLFRGYCMQLYTAHLWTNYRKASLQRWKVAVTMPSVYYYICCLIASENGIITVVWNIEKSSAPLAATLCVYVVLFIWTNACVITKLNSTSNEQINKNKLIPFTSLFNLHSQSIKLSIITNTFAGQSHVLQWDHCRWWGPPPCCLVCVMWTGFQSCGSLHPVLRWEAPMNNHHLSHLINRTDQKKKSTKTNKERMRLTWQCKLFIHILIICLYTLSSVFFPSYQTQPACGLPLPWQALAQWSTFDALLQS